MDPFDALLILTCSVLSDDTATPDKYGQKSRKIADWDVVASAVPCRLSSQAIGRPHELKVEIELSLNYRTIFMRPPTLSNGQTLNPHHYLLLTGIYYNVFEVLPMYDSATLHHLQVIVEEVKA